MEYFGMLHFNPCLAVDNVLKCFITSLIQVSKPFWIHWNKEMEFNLGLFEVVAETFGFSFETHNIIIVHAYINN